MAKKCRTWSNRSTVGTPVDDELREVRERGVVLRNREIVGELLRSVDLAGLRADGLILRDVDLRGATLREVEWLNCTLRDVRMDGSNGRGAVVRLCNFQRVHAAESDWSGAKLEDCDAQGLVLDGATLQGASLMETDLTRASLRGADLRDVDASGAVLRGADLQNADLRGASFQDADLRGADLRGAKLDDADLDGADLRGALLDGEDAEAEEESAEDPDAMPLPFGDMLGAVTPLVVDILRRGNQRGVIEPATLERLLGEIGNMGADPTVPLDGPLLQVLTRVSTTGVGPLLASLRERGDQPPPDVANLIKTLMGDAKLGAEATAEDLVVHLLQQLQTPVSSE